MLGISITIKMKIMPWPDTYGVFDSDKKTEILGLIDKNYAIPVCYPETNIIGYVDPAGDIYLLNGFLYASVAIPARLYYQLDSPKDLDFSDFEVLLDSSGKIKRILRIICGRKS